VVCLEPLASRDAGKDHQKSAEATVCTEQRVVQEGGVPPAPPVGPEALVASRKIDWVNNFWKAIAHDLAALKRTWESIKQVMAPSALDALTELKIRQAIQEVKQFDSKTPPQQNLRVDSGSGSRPNV
jgi:hypothetical protein